MTIECGRIDTVTVLDLASFALALLEPVHHAAGERSHMERPQEENLGTPDECREALQPIPHGAEELPSQNPKNCEQ